MAWMAARLSGSSSSARAVSNQRHARERHLLEQEPVGVDPGIAGLGPQPGVHADQSGSGRSFALADQRSPKEDEEKALHEGAHLIRRAAELWKRPDDKRRWDPMADKDWLDLAAFSGITITPDQVKSIYTNDLIDEIGKVEHQDRAGRRTPGVMSIHSVAWSLVPEPFAGPATLDIAQLDLTRPYAFQEFAGSC
jgi:hypothetical protein